MSNIKLVVAEKGSVGKSIAQAIGAKSRKDGYYEGNGYIVSWAVGHLIGLAQPEDYDAKYKRWNYGDLPIIPEQYKYNPGPKTKSQLKILVELMKRKDISTIVNACDSGREGELIFRLIYNHAVANSASVGKKATERLWISSMEESAIIDGFNKLAPGKAYDKLYQAALCRQQADWVVGMNFSRLFSIIHNAQLRVGRVQTPTLAMLVERAERIANFIKESFYVVELEGALPKGALRTQRERLDDKALADDIAEKCNGKMATVQFIENQRKNVSPQKLYDLTTLQREANRLFGYTASQTLEIAQELYEKHKLLTYPRTDSRFLTEDMEVGLPALIKSTIGMLPYGVAIKVKNTNPKLVVNNAKVSDHHAIIPTPSISTINPSILPEKERNILLLVATRFISAMSGKYIFDETAVVVACEGEIFKTKGKTLVEGGWMDIERAFLLGIGKAPRDEGEPLPKIEKGMKFAATTSVREGFTQPPKHYTEDTLLSAMENAGSEDMPDDAERKGLGTPATRANIIETLVKAGFVERKAKNLIATDMGVKLISVLPDNVKSPKMTAEWEYSLKDIEKGNRIMVDFMSSLGLMVRSTVEKYQPLDVSGSSGGSSEASPFTRNQEPLSEESIIGDCPRCGNSVGEKHKGYFCFNNECKFALFKDNKLFTSQKKKITRDIAVALVTMGSTQVNGFISKKSGKPYNAMVILDASGDGWPQFRLDFVK
ncbi:MAG: DNA topoisomerase 3 [Defluviitaleaceae bacterium]|nr:DNA topoisomerase 3 [Defluviitaleaceae bacterium]